ncbi:MAG: hypothetical protein R3217_09360 [Gammaproteobacteria bacterium]|nr:hypothetical protein [Gammaproteobacteria bacterium]
MAAQSDAFIGIEACWWDPNDDDLMEFVVTASNGAVSSVGKFYGSPGLLREFAESLTGFPSSRHPETVECKLGHGWAKLVLSAFNEGSLGVPFFGVKLDVNDEQADRRHSASFCIRSEAAEVDRFAARLLAYSERMETLVNEVGSDSEPFFFDFAFPYRELVSRRALKEES